MTLHDITFTGVRGEVNDDLEEEARTEPMPTPLPQAALSVNNAREVLASLLFRGASLNV